MNSPSDPDGLLIGYPVAIDLPVQWGDMDAFEHVNNTVYLRWFESGRIALGRSIGLLKPMMADRIGPILASVQCDYRRPIVFPDSVRVGTRVAGVGRTSLTMEHRVVSVGARAVAAEGRSVVVLYDYGKASPLAIPEALRRAIATLGAEAGRS